MMSDYSRQWISKIKVSGLAGSAQDVEYELNQDVNIFFGNNGSGKTSLLKILNAATSYTTDNIANIPFRSAKVTMNLFGILILERTIENKTFIQKSELPICETEMVTAAGAVGTATGPILASLLTAQATSTEETLEWKSVMSKITKDGIKPYNLDDPITYVLEHKYLPTSRLYLGLEQKNIWEKRQLTEQELEQYFAQRITNLWKEYNFDLSSKKASIQEEGLTNIMKNVWSLDDQKVTETDLDLERAYNRVSKFFERQKIKDILQSLDDFKSHINKQPYLMKVIKDINNIEESIEKEMIPKANLFNLITKLYGKKLVLNFEDKQITVQTKDGKEILLEALSSGQKQLLMIFLATLMASNNLILIDEPEISMHVDWQSELINDMHQLSPDAQIIVATHSPEISASVSDDKLFRL